MNWTVKDSKRIVYAYMCDECIHRGTHACNECFMKPTYDAIEKQIPRKPAEGCVCPNCKSRDIYYECSAFDHCPDCGQAIDWSKE